MGIPYLRISASCGKLSTINCTEAEIEAQTTPCPDAAGDEEIYSVCRTRSNDGILKDIPIIVWPGKQGYRLAGLTSKGDIHRPSEQPSRLRASNRVPKYPLSCPAKCRANVILQ